MLSETNLLENVLIDDIKVLKSTPKNEIAVRPLFSSITQSDLSNFEPKVIDSKMIKHQNKFK